MKENKITNQTSEVPSIHIEYDSRSKVMSLYSGYLFVALFNIVLIKHKTKISPTCITTKTFRMINLEQTPNRVVFFFLIYSLLFYV